MERMMPRSVIFLVILIIASTVGGANYEVKHPVYVGAKVCAECHQGKGMGHPYSLWLGSKHAKAYASLAKPEAKLIAELSGVPQEPQESVLCLGCHATGSNAEEWEKDPTFHVEDGVQCEKCHGPGSEYMEMSVMGDREAAIKNGLVIPTREDCENCHSVKGSHVQVHHKELLDIDAGMKVIAHPMGDEWEMEDAPPLPDVGESASGLAKYMGVYECVRCHKGPEAGYQFSKWRNSAHSRAFTDLATPKAYSIAQEKGMKEAPQKSPKCLKCHSSAYHEPAGGATDTYSLSEGVGCEGCHGPGSEYSGEEIMADEAAATKVGLRKVTKKTCVGCHEDSKEKPFDFEKAYAKIAHPIVPVVKEEKVQYKTPLNMAIRPGGRELWVACEAGHSVVIVDLERGEKAAEIAVGRHPHDVAFGPGGGVAYVSNRMDDTVSVIDARSRKVTATIAVGDEPHGLVTDARGKYLYVLNTSANSISVVDTQSLKEIKRLSASRNPWSLSLSADGGRILVTNTLSRFVEFRKPSVSEVTAIDTEKGIIVDRFEVPGANLMQGIAWHPGGEYALFTTNRTKNLVPMTRLLQGWTITNGLGIVWRDGRVDQVLLDEPSMSFPDPADVAISPKGKIAMVTSSGSNRVAVIDLEKMISMVTGATDEERERVLPNHLGKSTEFVIGHIGVEQSPRGIVFGADGKRAYAANALDDSITVIDVEKLEAVKRIDLGGPKVMTKVRFGERLFHSANIAFRRQFSCHSCHPDGHVDGLTYDIEPDGIGVSPVDNRTLRGILDTAPFKWTGLNPSLQRQCGARLAVFFTRIDPFTPKELSALENYICTIPRPPNRYRPLGAELTDAQRRGKEMFERILSNDGRIIPKDRRCVSCHFPPLYTDRRKHDVGTKFESDKDREFDTPHLNNIYDSAPYLHNGVAETLEEIWTRYNPEDKHGTTNDLTKDQLNDLIEYIRTL